MGVGLGVLRLHNAGFEKRKSAKDRMQGVTANKSEASVVLDEVSCADVVVHIAVPRCHSHTVCVRESA